MGVNLQISIITISAILISFLLLVAFLTAFPDPLSVAEKNFYSQKFDTSNKIFIIGSSHTGNLNSTLINELVSKNQDNYVVYNLSYNTDIPSKRQRTLDEIIDLNPKIIFYGISYNEFQSVITSKNKTNPDPSYVQNMLLDNFGSDFSNPQFVTLQIIRELQKYAGLYEKENYLKQPYTPFFEYHNEQLVIRNNVEIETQFLKLNLEFVVDDPFMNKEVIILKEMIDKLQKRGIKVVLFTTPYHQVFLNSVSDEQKNAFDIILSELSKSNVQIYRLDEKYADLSIWYNFDHVSYNQNAMIYSEDLAQFIINEIDN